MAIELLAPAGGMAQLKTALRFGADAIYGGMSRFGLRAYAGNFTDETIPLATQMVHDAGKKFYVTLNSLPDDKAMEGFLQVATCALEANVDAAIVSDVGAMALLHKHLPELPIHVSSQANVLNSEMATFLHETLGVERVVLSRELDLESIRRFRQNTPPALEIEAFVHGAMCMSHSGRCLLSSAIMGRSGNLGACAQPCRWKYHVVEEKRPGEYYPVMEDEDGTWIFSAYDLCMLEYLPEMINAGITSLKIEGRMKTAYYVACVVSTYRHALQILMSQGEEAYRKALPDLMREVKKASHRKSNTGFYLGKPLIAGGADGFIQTMQYVGDVVQEATEETAVKVEVKNKIAVGDDLELLTPEGSYAFTVTEMKRCDTGETVEKATVAGTEIYIPMAHNAQNGDLLRKAIVQSES